MISAESRNCAEANQKFHQRCEAFYHILNLYTERIAPELATGSSQVWDKLHERDKEHYLGHIKCHFISHAVRFNADSSPHRDSASSWGGFDAIAAFGRYQGGLLEFPLLGYALPSTPGDLFFIRGAGILHDMKGWEGEGRMVVALFSDRRIFTYERIPRPKDLRRMYGKLKYQKFREMHPCQVPPSHKRKRTRKEKEKVRGGMV